MWVVESEPFEKIWLYVLLKWSNKMKVKIKLLVTKFYKLRYTSEMIWNVMIISEVPLCDKKDLKSF